MLGFGALGEFPLADFNTPPPPTSVSLPPVALSLVSLDATLRAGKNIDGPAVALTLAAPVPTARTGKNVDLPPVSVNYSAPLPRALAGKSIDFPSVSLAFDTLPPYVQTGRIINLANTFTVTTEIGCLGEGALGEFVTGEGAPVTSTLIRPIRIALAVKTPAALAGKNENLPSVPISLHVTPPEVDARGRPIRINAIAS